MEARLASSILVGGLIRKAETEGGFAALLHKGDEIAGSVIVILSERGANLRVVERILQPTGHYSWEVAESVAAIDVPALVARRTRSDPDLWILELDVPSPERFAAQMREMD